jgi:hypothetical protein
MPIMAQGLNHMATYLNSERLNILVQALVSGSMDEHDKENAIKLALGELLDVWPESIENA